MYLLVSAEAQWLLISFSVFVSDVLLVCCGFNMSDSVCMDTALK